MLTLAAMHVLNDNNDPFFTSLAAGSYAKVKPQGDPCDAAFRDGCPNPQISKGGKIAMAVVITVTGIIIVSLLSHYVILMMKPPAMSFY